MIKLTHPGGGLVVLHNNTFTTYFNQRLFHQCEVKPDEINQVINTLITKGYTYS